MKVAAAIVIEMVVIFDESGLIVAKSALLLPSLGQDDDSFPSPWVVVVEYVLM